MTTRFPALLYAAGIGTRMRPLTDDRPKPLIIVGGEMLVGHAMNALRSDHVKHVVINTHYLADQIQSLDFDRKVTFSYEETLKETGGGLKHARALLASDTVITLNSDAVWVGPNPVDTLVPHWSGEMDGLLLLVPADRAAGHKGAGDFDIDGSGRLKRGTSSIYTGLQIIRTEVFEAHPKDVFSTNKIWEMMLEKGTLYGAIYSGQWCDVGWPGAIEIAKELLEQST